MILFIPGCGRPMAPQGHQGCCTTKILLEPKHKRKEDQQKDASKVDSLSFYALSFNLRPFADAEPRKQFGCLEHSDLFTVTAAGVATECREVEYHRTLRVTPYDPTCLRTELKVDVPGSDRSRIQARIHKQGSQIQLRAFQPQQHSHTLLEPELPRLLAPDLPSNGFQQ